MANHAQGRLSEHTDDQQQVSQEAEHEPAEGQSHLPEQRETQASEFQPQNENQDRQAGSKEEVTKDDLNDQFLDDNEIEGNNDEERQDNDENKEENGKCLKNDDSDNL